MAALALVFASVSASVEGGTYELSQSYIDSLNNMGGSWVAGQNFHPDTDMKTITNLMGLIKTEPPKRSIVSPRKPSRLFSLPKEFDARKAWPHCESLRHIRNQGNCGSCWAFAATEAFTDRLCIHKNLHVEISTEEVTACTQNEAFGCDGGMLKAGWDYFYEEGGVTGGGYHSNEGCQPYLEEPCIFNPNSTGPLKCKKVPITCSHKCRQGYDKSYQQDKHFSTAPIEVFSSLSGLPTSILHEIMTNGPVVTGMDVYSDFIHYKSGVYEQKNGTYLGAHAIKLFGWGHEDGMDFFWAANSWGPEWGDHGFFKIDMDPEKSGILSSIFSALPK